MARHTASGRAGHSEARLRGAGVAEGSEGLCKARVEGSEESGEAPYYGACRKQRGEGGAFGRMPRSRKLAWQGMAGSAQGRDQSLCCAATRKLTRGS